MELNIPSWIDSSFSALNASKFLSLKDKAVADIKQLGFPTTKLEDWRYTNVASILKTQFKKSELSKEQAMSLGLADILKQKPIGSRLVFLNGRLSTDLSDSLGFVQSLAKSIESNSSLVSEHLSKYAQTDSSGFVALNTASIEDGLLIHVEKSESNPIEIIYFSSGDEAIVNQRLLLVAEDNTEVKVVERFIGRGKYFTNYVAEVVLGENAKVEHYKIQEESSDAIHISRIEARQKNGSNYENHAFNFGAKLSRNEINPTLNGEKAFSLLHGLNILNQEQHIDNQTVLDHAQPNCDSREWYKGIYSDSSKGIFSGTIIVREGAQKTNAFQSNQSLLLSEDAESNSKPQLKIWADDVKCSHGATVGQLDADSLFYLRSRGVPKKTAESILITAFAGDILNPVNIEELKQEVEAKILAKLTF